MAADPCVGLSLFSGEPMRLSEELTGPKYFVEDDDGDWAMDDAFAAEPAAPRSSQKFFKCSPTRAKLCTPPEDDYLEEVTPPIRHSLDGTAEDCSPESVAEYVTARESLRGASKLPDAAHVVSRAPSPTPFAFEDFMRSEDGGLMFTPLGESSDKILDARSKAAFDILGAAAGRPLDAEAGRSSQARAVARSLARALQATAAGMGPQEPTAHACGRLVEAVAALGPDAARAVADLCDHYRFSSLERLADFADVAAREAEAAAERAAAKRRAWRPVAKWKALLKARDAEAASMAALELFSELAGGAEVEDQLYGSLESRALAYDLASTLCHLLKADSNDADAPRLGEACGGLARRAFDWSADDVRVVLGRLAALRLDPAARLDQLADFCVALEQTSRRKKKRPAQLPAKQLRKLADKPPPAQKETKPARALLDHVVACVKQHADCEHVYLSGVDVAPYEAATFRRATVARRLGRMVAALLHPVRAGALFEWGPDTDAQFAWRFDPRFAAQLPDAVADRVSTPRGLAGALFTHNALQQCEPSQKHTLELQQLVAEAERMGVARAGWLSPYYVNLAPDVTLKCRDCYARDPASEATAFATVCSPVTRVGGR